MRGGHGRRRFYGGATGRGAEDSLWFGVVLCIGLSLCAVGCGLIVACVARTPMEAANFGAAVLMPMVFLSGSMFPVPAVPLFEVVEAMRATLTYGLPWTESLPQLVATVVLSLGYLAVGVVLFQKVRMRTEY